MTRVRMTEFPRRQKKKRGAGKRGKRTKLMKRVYMEPRHRPVRNKTLQKDEGGTNHP